MIGQSRWDIEAGTRRPSLVMLNMRQDFTRHPALAALLLVGIFIGFFYGIASLPLFDLDEGAFSEATREMFARGDFISTYLNGVPRYDKPILIYWLQAASVAVFGVNEFAFRLPSSLAATLWVGLVYVFVRRRRDARTALLAALMVTTALSITVIGKAAIADALLNMLLAAAMFAAFEYLQTRERSFLYAAFVAVGLGFLTKGPVAVLIPIAVTFLFCAVKRDLRLWLRTVFDPRALALFALIAFPWYVVQYLKEGQAFIDGFFFKHNVGRFSSPMEGHGGSLIYYLPVVLVGVMPFTAAAVKAVAHGREIFKGQDDFRLYLLLWFGFVFVFFSLSGTKLPHYMNYGYTGLLILAALYLGELRSRLWAFLPPLLFMGLLLVLPWVVEWALPRVDDAFYRAGLSDTGEVFGPAYLAYFAVALAVLAYFMFERRFDITGKLVVSGLIVSLGVAAFLLPAVARIHQAPLKEAAAIAAATNEPVVMWGLNMPSFSVYTQRVTERRAPKSGELVLTKEERLQRLAGYELLYLKHGVALVRVAE